MWGGVIITEELFHVHVYDSWLLTSNEGGGVIHLLILNPNINIGQDIASTVSWF